MRQEPVHLLHFGKTEILTLTTTTDASTRTSKNITSKQQGKDSTPTLQNSVDIQRGIRVNPLSPLREISRKCPKNICIYSSVYVGWGLGSFALFLKKDQIES